MEKFKNFALDSEQMKKISGGIETWDCSCGGGTIFFNGFGNNGDFRQDVIDAGCSGSPTYCFFHQL